jgi:hypothetical protein
MNNGRIDTLPHANYGMYALFETGNDKISQFNREAIIGVHQQTPLNELFFSRQNIEALQVGIRNMVSMRTNGEFIIGKQSEVELQVIMRAIYLKDAKHLNHDILKQVKELNSQVIDFCVPRIIEEVRMFKYYKKDIGSLPIPLDRGQFSSSKGLRILETREL